ncbi:MAG: hypothetical protein KDA42_09575 [Planctomycetales bacterium]|nr:hypothetical protein [Planctomycetales bacterium]
MQVRDRIKELRRVPARDLRPNARNWRMHPEAQRNALRGVLAEIGLADALLVRELPNGVLELIDGHLRAETLPDQHVPVLVLDVDEADANKILATLDPLAAMAEANAERLDDLLKNCELKNEAVQQLCHRLIQSEEVDASPPPSAAGPPCDIPATYQVIVECQDEDEQQEVYEQLASQGRRCRVLTL